MEEDVLKNCECTNTATQSMVALVHQAPCVVLKATTDLQAHVSSLEVCRDCGENKNVSAQCYKAMSEYLAKSLKGSSTWKTALSAVNQTIWLPSKGHKSRYYI